MWRIWNKLFGWQYIIAECGYYKKMKISKVQKFGSKFYYKCENRFMLITEKKFSSDMLCVPVSMNQRDFNKMIEINKEK